MKPLGTAIRLFFAGILLGNVHAGTEEPYNVLLIISDDLNSRIAPLGDVDAITPNLTRLAARTVNYRNCLSQYPFCAPSRGSFLTGLFPWNLGIHAAGGATANGENVVPNRMWMSQYFRSEGYWAGSYGKVEHYERSERWDELIPRTFSVDGRFSSVRDFSGHKGISGDTSFIVYDGGDPAKFADGVTATGAMAAMGKCLEADQKFFVAVGFFMPHTPWIVPKAISDLYDPATFTLPEYIEESYDNAYWPPYAYPYGKAADERPLLPEEDLRELFHAYYSAVTLMDHNLGRVLDFADANNLWDNTVIVFASDNGFSLMEHLHLYSKRNYSRESIHVPMMIHHPGMATEGRVCDRQVGLIDVLPTALDLAGVSPYPKPIDGQSLAPLQENPDREWNTPALSCTTYPKNSKPRFRIGQLGTWKLVEGPFFGSYRRVMDHAADPGEHFGTFPNGIDPRALGELEEALSGIPFQDDVFYVKKPALGTADRDEDGLSDEQELDLRLLGFSPFLNDGDAVERFRHGGVSVERFPESVRISLAGLPVIPGEFNASHDYPLRLQRSFDLSGWEDLPGIPGLGGSGLLEWTDDSSAAEKAFYRFVIEP